VASADSGGGGRSRWPRFLMPTVLAGAALVLIALAVGFSATTRAGGPAPAPSSSEGGCERLEARPRVRQVSRTVVFPEVWYAVDRSGGRPRIDLAGGYQGVVGEGRRIAVIVRADFGSYDPETGRPYGDGRYYYEREIRLDEETGCWSAMSLDPAYGGAPGMVWHVYLVLVPADFGVTSVSARNHVEDEVFAAQETLAEFTVPT
jgi:hypothetical protein